MDNKAKEEERLKLNGAIEAYLSNGGTIKKLTFGSMTGSSAGRLDIDDIDSDEDNFETDQISFKKGIRNRKPEQIL